ncbi:lipocalin family protein [Vibrio paucivorans]|uniref:Outer membrane lipoprotein Blc n=1 Tax=Vibrio paucivorans TaxID=2829489 RepID=A0A9X3CBA7_9VIBR|nr:lipocalin family protein [Vibrio paucivorans]MCW8332510.1 lipocalin family protein [Vibrio paucivorans]
MRQLNQFLVACFLSALALGCSSISQYLMPVEKFDIAAYMGTWYEVARSDSRYAQGLTHTRTQFVVDQDGDIRVINSGWSDESQQWKEAIGKVRLGEDQTVGQLHVSFSGPFYDRYVVFYLEPDYSTALVTGDNDQFWLLSRTSHLPDYKMNKYLRIAEQAGFKSEQLVFPFEETEQPYRTN